MTIKYKQKYHSDKKQSLQIKKSLRLLSPFVLKILANHKKYNHIQIRRFYFYSQVFLKITTFLCVFLFIFSNISDVYSQVSTSVKVKIEVTGSENASIQAIDDRTQTEQGRPVRISVTENDVATNSFVDRTSISIVSQTGNPTISVKGYYIEYNPRDTFFGEDSFVYRVCNTQFDCDEATVFVTVLRSSSVQPEPQQDPQTPPQTNPQNNSRPLPPISLPVTGGFGTTLSLLGLVFFVIMFIFFKKRNFKVKEEVDTPNLEKLKNKKILKNYENIEKTSDQKIQNKNSKPS